MPISDKKKVAHLVYRLAVIAEEAKAAAAKIVAVRAAFVAHSPDVTGTPLEGKVSAVNAWMAGMEAVADDPITGALIAAKTTRHRQPSALGEGL